MFQKRIALLFIITFFSLKTVAQNGKYPKNEFRAVWIATVVNIDWPRIASDSIEKQKADFIEILDAYKKLNFNAVIVQIRPTADAFYPTEFAPWSRYLTNKEGQAPAPFYDPLAWMIEQAHERGFEFHAWFNPFRATFNLKIETLSPTHDLFLHPDWMIQYGEKYYYNPALPEVQAHLNKIIAEVVQNYDIDAVHFDDYFYPYKIVGEDFNDYESYFQSKSLLSIEGWRRENVNTFVSQIHATVKKIKPWVQFGISPFGVWRNKSKDPNGSETQTGQTNYDDLFADTKVWDENKWVDYMLPQLYWSIGNRLADYNTLLKWWAENTKNSNLYIGNGSYKIKNDADKRWNNIMEIPNQIDSTRTYPNIQGNAFYNANSLVNKNIDVTDFLKANQYKYPAIPYPVPNAKRQVAEKPVLKTIVLAPDGYQFVLQKTLTTPIRYVLLYAAENAKLIDTENPSQLIDKVFYKATRAKISILAPNEILDKNNAFAVSFIDFYGNESEKTIIEFSKK